LCARGISIIYISHRLDEVRQIAQRITVLRDGKLVGTRKLADVSQRDVVQMMVGHDVHGSRAGEVAPGVAHGGPPVLALSGLTRGGIFTDINLTVTAGEIVGIFGLLGAGHDSIIRTEYGEQPADSGSILVDGREIIVLSPRDARRAGIGFVPADRKVLGLILDMNVRENITLSNWRGLARWGFFRSEDEQQRTQQWIERLAIRSLGGMAAKLRFLSGGNQQRVVLARWLEANVKVLLLNEPTWGVDVGARRYLRAA
jgi:rhamnose transport system ATP-binding protein